jgi:hypothetical protein
MQYLSTGFVDALTQTSPLVTIMQDVFIDVYTGSQPASADAAPTGTKLWTATKGSDGITALDVEHEHPGRVQKPVADTWGGTAVASGTAGWCRIRKAGDLGTLNTTDIRIDGAIGTDMTVNTTVVESGVPQVVKSYVLSFKQ